MKIVAAFLSTLALASAFAPQSSPRSSTQLNEKLFDKVCSSKMIFPPGFLTFPGKREAFLSTSTRAHSMLQAVTSHALTFISHFSFFMTDLSNGPFRTSERTK
jgi:hypothetical protein